MKRLPILLAGLMLGFPFPAAAVTITKASPIEKLDADGHPSGVSMATVGASFSLVKQDGSDVILKDAGGAEYRIAAAATDYSAPVVSTSTAAPAQTAAVTEAAPMPAPAAPASGPAAPSDGSSALGKDDTEKLKQINEALGFPLLSETSFWQDDVEAVAQRVGWPQESKTTTEESFRRYANEGQVKVFGASAYSLALYGKMGKPTYLSLIFANAGDFAEARKMGDSKDVGAIDAVKKDLAVAVKKDAQTITDALTPILGEPSISLFGNSSSNRDEVHRWDWNGVAILLNSHQGEYASIKIIPTEAADRFGTVDVIDRDEMRDLLAKRVVKRDNGDVIVSELPMVDQGPKGYCVPATWERYLRYVDVPADLYVLAIMGHTGLGGSTSAYLMRAGVDDYVSAYHRRIENYDAPLDVAHVAKYIDQGLPLMWPCWVSEKVEKMTNKNTRDRKTVTDWDAYAKSVAEEDKALGSSFKAEDPDHGNGHMRLIIGYNAATDEIAISDSWGETMAERWMYAGTAKRINQGEMAYLSW